MVTLSSCLIWQIISFNFPPKEYGCVYAWTTLVNITKDRPTEDADSGKKEIIFSDEAHFDLIGYVNKEDADFGIKIIFSNEAHFDPGGNVNKQNCRIWGTENRHTYIEKPAHPKTSHCLVRILVQRHNWAVFLRTWTRRGRYSQWRSLSGHVERIFVHKNWRGEYWQHLVSTGRHYVLHSRSHTRCFASCFWRSHYQLCGWCRLATSRLQFGTVGLLFVGCRQR